MSKRKTDITQTNDKRDGVFNWALAESDNDNNPTTRFLGWVGSILGIIVGGYYIRMLDWWSTAELFDARFTHSAWPEPVLLGNGRFVTKESLIISVGVWLTITLLTIYLQQVPWFYYTLSEVKANGEKVSQVLTNGAIYSVNWSKWLMWCAWFGIGRWDDYADASVHFAEGSLDLMTWSGLSNFMLAMLVFGVMSEFLFGYSAKIFIDNSKFFWYLQRGSSAGKKAVAAKTKVSKPKKKSPPNKDRTSRQSGRHNLPTHQPQRGRTAYTTPAHVTMSRDVSSRADELEEPSWLQDDLVGEPLAG